MVFILIGADAELGLLKNLGVETKKSKYGEVPVYDEETFETNVAGVYVAGHFTEARHIAGAIKVPQMIVPKIAAKLGHAARDKMNKRKTFWIMAGIAVFLFFFAVSVFLLSVYFGEQTKDTDLYAGLGWFAMLEIMLLSMIFGCASLGILLSQRNKTIKIFKDS